MAPGFSPLDEVLGLSGGGRYSGRVLQWLVRLGAELPFARAAFWLEELTGVAVSAATVRRQTEAVGATAVALVETAVARLERETPEPPVRPARLVLGADGAMVPLVGGEWAEVKLLSIGEPTPGAPDARADGPRRTLHVSYFARLADAATFSTQALGELHRRGLEAAGAVAAVQDGAPWLQGFVDEHRPDAVRILDWPHAAQHLTTVAEALFGVHTVRAQRVAERLRRWLWVEGPARVLAILTGWARASSDRPDVVAAAAYFRDRQAQVDYPAFRVAGWPVGSGATESGHKQVMQARMKRAGMHWARPHVNPLLALSLLEHNGRWASEGATLLRQHRAQHLHAHRQRQRTRRAARPTRLPLTACPPCRPPAPAPPRRRFAPAAHPWRRYGVPLSVKI